MAEKEEKLEMEGEVIEALRNGYFRVALDNGHETLGYVAGQRCVSCARASGTALPRPRHSTRTAAPRSGAAPRSRGRSRPASRTEWPRPRRGTVRAVDRSGRGRTRHTSRTGRARRDNARAPAADTGGSSRMQSAPMFDSGDMSDGTA